MSKGLNYQCLYDIDDSIYKYTAFNQDGTLCAFTNAPVRDFKMGVWVDSVTGQTGDLQLFERWDQSMRMPDDMKDARTPMARMGTKATPANVDGKKGIRYKRKVKGEMYE